MTAHRHLFEHGLQASHPAVLLIVFACVTVVVTAVVAVLRPGSWRRR